MKNIVLMLDLNRQEIRYAHSHFEHSPVAKNHTHTHIGTHNIMTDVL